MEKKHERLYIYIKIYENKLEFIEKCKKDVKLNGKNKKKKKKKVRWMVHKACE